MFDSLFHSEHLWLSGGFVLLCFVGFAIIGVKLSKKMPNAIREQHTDVISYGLATISIFTAVLLTSIAVIAWEHHDTATKNVSKEAELVGDVMRSALAMPEPLRSDIFERGINYLDVVLNEEWPSMANDEVPFSHGWDQLIQIHRSAVGFTSTNSITQIQYSMLYGKIHELFDARRERILSYKNRLQPIVWISIVAAALINISFLFFFSLKADWLHHVIAIMVSVAIGFVFVLTILFDRPFEGALAIQPKAYENVKANFLKYKPLYIQ
ncbi:MAG: DUF4239 domain-containing protein [Rhodocyclaceae bacterium]|jgi:hypothetical protein|nr:DUF4239 domain-containing protein [Rhodocyclaceae bacterium]